LSGADVSSNMFIEGDVTDGLTSSMKEASSIIDAIAITIASIGTYKLLDWIISGNAKTFFTKTLVDGKNKIVDIGSSLAFAFAVYEIIKNIKDLIDNWNSKSLADKIKGICKIALYGIGAILIAIGALMTSLGNIPYGITLKIAGTSAIAMTGVLDAVGVFANGGIAEKGSLFIANEAGPELVYSGHNNASSIMNIEQFKQAQFEALTDWWDYAKNDLPDTPTFTIDGAQIARSKSFKNELNRTNAGLNLR
jgi:hypothetical protein